MTTLWVCLVVALVVLKGTHAACGDYSADEQTCYTEDVEEACVWTAGVCVDLEAICSSRVAAHACRRDGNCVWTDEMACVGRWTDIDAYATCESVHTQARLNETATERWLQIATGCKSLWPVCAYDRIAMRCAPSKQVECRRHSDLEACSRGLGCMWAETHCAGMTADGDVTCGDFDGLGTAGCEMESPQCVYHNGLCVVRNDTLQLDMGLHAYCSMDHRYPFQDVPPSTHNCTERDPVRCELNRMTEAVHTCEPTRGTICHLRSGVGEQCQSSSFCQSDGVACSPRVKSDGYLDSWDPFLRRVDTTDATTFKVWLTTPVFSIDGHQYRASPYVFVQWLGVDWNTTLVPNQPGVDELTLTEDDIVEMVSSTGTVPGNVYGNASSNTRAMNVTWTTSGGTNTLDHVMVVVKEVFESRPSFHHETYTGMALKTHLGGGEYALLDNGTARVFANGTSWWSFGQENPLAPAHVDSNGVLALDAANPSGTQPSVIEGGAGSWDGGLRIVGDEWSLSRVNHTMYQWLGSESSLETNWSSAWIERLSDGSSFPFDSSATHVGKPADMRHPGGRTPVDQIHSLLSDVVRVQTTSRSEWFASNLTALAKSFVRERPTRLEEQASTTGKVNSTLLAVWLEPWLEQEDPVQLRLWVPVRVMGRWYVIGSNVSLSTEIPNDPPFQLGIALSVVWASFCVLLISSMFIVFKSHPFITKPPIF